MPHDPNIARGKESRFLKRLVIALDALLDVPQIGVTREKADVAMSQRDEVARSLSRGSNVPGRNAIKIAVGTDAIQ